LIPKEGGGVGGEGGGKEEGGGGERGKQKKNFQLPNDSKRTFEKPQSVSILSPPLPFFSSGGPVNYL